LRIATFGGTFDPVHNGHLAIAREAARRFALERVLFIPAARPPHKEGETSAGYEDRYRMVELACQGEPLFEPSRLEAGQGRSFSILTIERLRAHLAPEDELFFLIGADAFADIATWLRWQDVVRAVEFIVVGRPGASYRIPSGARVLALDTLSLPVSSSSIRAEIASGRAPADLPGPVLEYALQKGLYRRGVSARG
jgi:nicotinate-nucleotide adenylyltransferase